MVCMKKFFKYIKECKYKNKIEPNDGLSEYYQNLVDKVHKAIERRRKLENMEDLDEMIDVMEALEESQGQILH